MGIGSIVSAVSGLAGLAGGLKGGKTESAPVSGYATYPQWLKDLYEKTFAPAALTEFKKEYEAIPMTRYESVDPFFGSAQLNVLQRMSDAQGGMFGKYTDPNAPAAGGGNTAADAEAQAQAMADMEARMIARQYLMGSGASPMETTEQARRRQMFEAGLYDDKSLASIGKYVSGMNQWGGMQSAAALDMVNRNSPDVVTAYQQAQQAALAEATKRKAMGA